MGPLRAAALVALVRAGGPLRGRLRGPRGGLRIPLRPCSAPPAPAVAAKEPFAVELKAGQKYGWCACGHSRRQPFCDGAHKKAAPGISPLRFVAEEDKTVWLCGCKRTRTPPYCDGTHKTEAVQSAQLPPNP